MRSNPDQPRSPMRCPIISVTVTGINIGIIIGINFLLHRFAFHDTPGFLVTNFHAVNPFSDVVVHLNITNYNDNTRISYGSISAFLSYGSDQIANSTVAPFDQVKHALTKVQVMFKMPDGNSECGFDRPFSVELSTIARYVDVRKVKALSVDCYGIWVGCRNATTASMLGTHHICAVYEH